jgi:phosphatidylinositol-3-phosphatase
MSTVPGHTSRPRVIRRVAAVLCAMVALGGVGACGGPTPAPAGPTPTAPVTAVSPSTAGPTQTADQTRRTRPDHVVVVVFENKAVGQIDGSANAPYLNALMADSAVLTESRGVTHPSQPNYLALFAGSTHDVTDNRCPLNLGDQPNLGRQLLDAGFSFAGYSEGLPAVGFTGCSAGRYAAKHSPWVNFSNLPATVNQPFSAFPADFAQLPTVAFVTPDLCSDMHDCSVSTGDSWLRDHFDGYVHWAQQHNSLLVVTFDEDDSSADNRILTLVAGAGVRPGRYGQPVDHYRLLSTVEALYGLPPLGLAATTSPLADIWG